MTTDTLKTARTAGAAYLALAVTGMLGFLILRPQLIDADDPAATLAHLVDRPELAHLLVLLEMGIVLSQAIAAVSIFKLFRPVNPTAAYATATFGLVNAVAILASGTFMATANSVAADAALAPGGDAAGSVSLLYELSSSSWGMGSLFFGLWLIPMGWVALSSGRFPKLLGYLLVAGGVGYVAAGLVNYGIADAPGWAGDTLSLPASVGEFWMIGYLLIKGMRPAPAAVPAATTVATTVEVPTPA